MGNYIMRAAIGLFILIASGYLLVIGKELFVPLVIAIFICFLIKTIATLIQKNAPIAAPAFAYISSSLFLLFLIAVPIYLVSSSVPDILLALPKYEENILSMFENILNELPFDQASLTQEVKSNLNISDILSTLANSITSFTSNFLLVIIYMAFIFAEKGLIKNKLLMLADDDNQKQKFETIISNIDERIALYIAVKAQLSFLTGLLSYIVMIIIGIDFAAFWALLIFMLNFIPSIGSIVGTVFPVLLALIQFDSPWPALIALIGIGLIQIAIGNIIEPKMMGKSLNLSPFVILIVLFVWGSIWGITGLFLSIPITVFLMIIFAEFQNTRPISILLSSNGKL